MSGDQQATILQRLAEWRVFSIERMGDVFMVGEECDRYYGLKLTRGELRQLAAEILELANHD